LERTAALLEANAERRSERRAHGRRKGTEPSDIEMEMEKSAFHMRRTVDEMERWAAQVESNELPRHQMEAGAQQQRFTRQQKRHGEALTDLRQARNANHLRRPALRKK